MSVDYRVGDTREVIKTIADGSVDLIASSPPFLALRSYVPADHESKGDEIGSERNPAEFIDMLLGLTAEWGRVLAPHGSIAIELGDTYSGSGGAGGDYNEGGLRDGQGVWASQAKRSVKRTSRGVKRSIHDPDEGEEGYPYKKSLALIPQLYAVALAYGINPLTGQPSPAGRWLVRNVIVWHRPNPAVGALGDKVRPSTSYIVIATRSPKRWFDLSAVRGEPSANTHARTANGVASRPTTGKAADRDGNFDTLATLHSTAGAPPLDAWFDHYDGSHDTWTLTTQPSRIKADIVERVPCGPDDGGERTTSPDCPVHGDRADLASTERCGEPATSPSSRTSRTDDRHDPERDPAAVRDALTSSRSGQPTATPHSTSSNRTAPAPSTNQPDTPSAQTAVDIARTQASLASFGAGLDTLASSNAEACPRADEHETATHSGDTSDPSAACTCTFHLEKHSIHSHYAMWPAKLAERLILSMCPREVCRLCGEARRRVERNLRDMEYRPRQGDYNDNTIEGGTFLSAGQTTYETLGWTDCGCEDYERLATPDEVDNGCELGIAYDSRYRPGLVLDPFAGSGTTLAVADLHGRDAVGIDFDSRNRDIHPARYDEVRRALFGSPIPDANQLNLFRTVGFVSGPITEAELDAAEAYAASVKAASAVVDEVASRPFPAPRSWRGNARPDDGPADGGDITASPSTSIVAFCPHGVGLRAPCEQCTIDKYGPNDPWPQADREEQ